MSRYNLRKLSLKERFQKSFDGASVLCPSYVLLMVALGFSFSMAHFVIVASHSPKLPIYLELFLLYCYGIGVIFLVYLHAYIIRRREPLYEKENAVISQLVENVIKTPSFNLNAFVTSRLSETTALNKESPELSTKNSNEYQEEGDTTFLTSDSSDYNRPSSVERLSSQPQENELSITKNLCHEEYERVPVSVYYGEGINLYSRLGAIAFGFTSIIYLGYDVAEHLTREFKPQCQDVFHVIVRFIAVIFTLLQSYFVFKNHKITIMRHLPLVRLGLAHLISTNLVSWVYLVVHEAKESLEESEHNEQSLERHGAAVTSGEPHHYTTAGYDHLKLTDHFFPETTQTGNNFSTVAMQNFLNSSAILMSSLVHQNFSGHTSSSSIGNSISSGFTHENATPRLHQLNSTYHIFPETTQIAAAAINKNISTDFLHSSAILISSLLHQNLSTNTSLDSISSEYQPTASIHRLTPSDRHGSKRDLWTKECGSPLPLKTEFASYLIPCLIEYYLIAAAAAYRILHRVGDKGFLRTKQKGADISRWFFSRVNKGCQKANKGLFAGMTVAAISVVAITSFLILHSKEEYHAISARIFFFSEISLMMVNIIACIIGMRKITRMRKCKNEDPDFDVAILHLTLFGVYVFFSFIFMAGVTVLHMPIPKKDEHEEHKAIGVMALILAFVTVVQATFQTILISDGLRRFPKDEAQFIEKPGRPFVTFLIVTNLVMWIVNTFEIKKAHVMPMQENLYGQLSWTIISQICLPLLIFFRFHSSACLADIWKSSYSKKES